MFITVLTQVVILFILIILGIILQKTNILNDTAIKGITDVVLIIVTPCVIIKAFIRKFNASDLKYLLICFSAAVAVHLVFIILSRVIFRNGDERKTRVLRFAVVFSNCGYMSLPIQQSLLGDEGVFYGAAFIAVFNVFVWTYGITDMSGDKKYISPKNLLLNPGIIGVAVGLLIFLLSIPIPPVVSEPIGYMASLNTPLPMIIIGYHLAKTDILSGIKDKSCIFAVLIRIIVFPLAALGGMYLCGIRGNILTSVTISCCAPAAAITTMFSSKFNNDTSLSVNIVSLSTIFSILSIPLIVSLSQYIA